jgi:hypothetical protein
MPTATSQVRHEVGVPSIRRAWLARPPLAPIPLAEELSWDRPWDTKRVLPGSSVPWELWGVPSVLVERWECFCGALVMPKSRVRIP